MKKGKTHSRELHRDPITGAPGAHPVGTGIGAAAGGSVGGALGAVGGPIGSAIGIAAGAAAGGLVGKVVAENTDPETENEYWRVHYASRPYIDRSMSYDHYEPAYRTGYEGWQRYRDRHYEDVEEQLRHDYESAGGGAKVAWEKAKAAVRDAWNRMADAVSADDDDFDARRHDRY